MNTREQGDLGERAAVQWLWAHGWSVFVPFGHAPDVDLFAVRGPDRLAVQVKTSTSFRHGRWAVATCTRGGNQSWSGLVKRFSPERCDRLFVLVGDGRQWFIPSSAISGGNGLLLGGPKYEAYEVDQGRPIRSAPLPCAPAAG